MEEVKGTGKIADAHLLFVCRSATVLLVFVSMFVSKASIERLGEIFKQEPSVSDKDADEELKVEKGTVEFRGVTFKYSESVEKNILENVNLTFNHGETIGIIGGTSFKRLCRNGNCTSRQCSLSCALGL